MFYLFFGGMVGQFLKLIIPAQQKLPKKQMVLGATGKKPASAFHYSGLIFDVKNFLHKLLPTKTNHAQPKCEKKMNVPENCIIKV